MTIDDILNIPKSGKKYFDHLEWVDDFYHGTGYWVWGVKGLKNGLFFAVEMPCDFKKAKEIVSDEGRLVEYLKMCEPMAYKRLFVKCGRPKDHVRRWNRWQVKRR